MTKQHFIALAQAPTIALQFVGQITVSQLALDKMPCSDYDLEKALEGFIAPPNNPEAHGLQGLTKPQP